MAANNGACINMLCDLLDFIDYSHRLNHRIEISTFTSVQRSTETETLTRQLSEFGTNQSKFQFVPTKW